MAPVCKVLVLQQIKLEKNGFHSLKEQQISITYHIKLLSRTLLLSEYEGKWQYTSLSSFNVRTNVQKNGPFLPNFDSSAN